MKSWEETIAFIRTQDAYKDLVRDAYFDADLEKNVQRFYESAEYAATKALIRQYTGKMSGRLLDLGAGNGISSIAFALDGMQVVALEPDKSETVGALAIECQKKEKQLNQLEVVATYAEDAPFEDNSFDIVYARQSMHHAYELQSFIAQAARVLKPGGLLITVRDHVIDEGKLNEFLDNHPLHKFYGGENAFTLSAYMQAFQSNGLEIKKILKPFDSPINRAPISDEELLQRSRKFTLGIPVKFLFPVFMQLMNWRNRKLQGRMYSFICTKS